MRTWQVPIVAFLASTIFIIGMSVVEDIETVLAGICVGLFVLIPIAGWIFAKVRFRHKIAPHLGFLMGMSLLIIALFANWAYVSTSEGSSDREVVLEILDWVTTKYLVGCGGAYLTLFAVKNVDA